MIAENAQQLARLYIRCGYALGYRYVVLLLLQGVQLGRGPVDELAAEDPEVGVQELRSGSFALRVRDGMSSWVAITDLAKAKYDRAAKGMVNEQSFVFPEPTRFPGFSSPI